MKKKFLFVPIFLFTFLLSGCGFDNIFANKLLQVEIADSKAKDGYTIDDIYDKENGLTITGKYFDGSVRGLAYSSVTKNMYYMNGSNKVSWDTSKPFVEATDYVLTVTVEGKTSNEIKFTVLADRVFAESISVSGEHNLNQWDFTDLTITINPSNYNLAVRYEVSDETKIKATRTSTGYTIQALGAGEIDFTVLARDSLTTEISATHHFTITASNKLVDMKQTYQDFVTYNAYNISSCPLSGSPKLLVIPVWFTDSDSYISASKKNNVREDISLAYFGSSLETGWHSVKSYYYQESGGKLDLKGTVSDWYECGYSSVQAGSMTNSTSIVKKATKWYFQQNPSEKIADYDVNSDGYLDGVMLIYAAPDNSHEEFEQYGNLWAYCFWCQEYPTIISPVVANAYFWASYDFMYGSNAYTRTGSSWSNGYTEYGVKIDSHTYIHEMGHVFGLEDYYDYSHTSNPAGGFSMQDYNVGAHDPFSTLAFGWTSAYIPTETSTITLRSNQEGHEVIILTPSWNSYDSPFDEYLIIEFYTPDGLNDMDVHHPYCGAYPSGSSTSGIRLWHVDARLIKYMSQSNPVLSSPDTRTGNIALVNSNTYYSDNQETNKRLSPLGSAYYDFNILQLIRNDKTVTFNYNPEAFFEAKDLFTKGQSFSMSDYKNQFAKQTKLNSGVDLGWTFKVDNIYKVNSYNVCDITVTKTA